MKYTDLTIRDQQDILQRTQAGNGLNLQVIEKDWWVTAVLRALFSLPYAEHISFKGGTCLSKCWNLISRMSEDVDIAIDREFLGFGGTLSKTQVSDKLRRASCMFVREKLQYDLTRSLVEGGVRKDKFSITVNITSVTTTDPEIIVVEYQPAFTVNPYIRPKVIVEISGRSMSEPVIPLRLFSFIDKVYARASFSEPEFEVRAVLPQRTFLEKLFLLHEEFSKPQGLMRTERMSRHHYDIGQMMDTSIAEEALTDEALYQQVIKHRRNFIGLKGFDYSSLYPPHLQIMPPAIISDAWKEDYETMQETMIYGESLPFNQLMEKMKCLNERIGKLSYRSL